MRTADRRRSRSVIALVLSFGVSASAVACRVNDDDLKRWETTEHGPEKLAAVLTHDKYDKDLRIEAAWSLVEMKKRGGQSIGVKILLDSLIDNVSAKDRADILAGLWKKLRPKVEEPISQAGDGKWADPSVIYKDATFSLYSAAKEDRPGAQKLDLDSKIFDDMSEALTDWAVGKVGDDVNQRMQSFETRLDNTAQQFGIEQVMRAVGVPGTKRLPSLLTAKNAIKSQRLDVVARLVAEVKPRAGAPNEQTDYDKARDELSSRFAKLLADTLSGGYVDSVRAETDAALNNNPQGKEILAHKNDAEKDPTKNPYVGYFLKVRDERLQYLFTILKGVGGKPVVDQLMAIAKDKNQAKEQRAFALAALEGNYDTKEPSAMKSFLEIAKSDAPDEVKHVALIRIAAYPPEEAVKAYYSLFDNQNWKVRYDGATQILGIVQKLGDKAKTTAKEFLDKLPDRPNKPMALGEPSTYGGALANWPKEMNVKPAVDAALKGDSLGAKLTALGWYLAVGTKADMPMLEKYETSKEAVPKCKEDDGCNWDTGCPVPKPGAKPDDPPEKQFDMKPVATVGDYVTYCVKVQIEQRAKAPPSDKTDDNKK